MVKFCHQKGRTLILTNVLMVFDYYLGILSLFSVHINKQEYLLYFKLLQKTIHQDFPSSNYSSTSKSPKISSYLSLSFSTPKHKLIVIVHFVSIPHKAPPTASNYKTLPIKVFKKLSRNISASSGNNKYSFPWIYKDSAKRRKEWENSFSSVLFLNLKLELKTV